MGKEGKYNQPPQPVQPVNTAPTQPQAPLPPQTPELLAGAKLLGQPVRALVDGRMQTIFLTEYEPGGTYWGTAVRNNPAEGKRQDAQAHACTGTESLSLRRAA